MSIVRESNAGIRPQNEHLGSENTSFSGGKFSDLGSPLNSRLTTQPKGKETKLIIEENVEAKTQKNQVESEVQSPAQSVDNQETDQ